MGKSDEQLPAQPDHSQEAQQRSSNCFPNLSKYCNVFSFKCILVLILSVCVCLSAIFWLPPLRSLGSGSNRRHTHKFSVPIEAIFELSKPISLVEGHIRNLESDIMDEIGVPNTKVAVLSFNSSNTQNWTKVVFGVLPNPSNAHISSWAMSLVRASLVELVTQQTNLSLNQSLFGHAAAFGMIKFPGGVTVVPVQYASIWQKAQVLFNFTLNNSISQVQENLRRLKGQLEYGLQLKPYENVYVELTNLEGSTLHPPVIVQASVYSSMGSSRLMPQRLKQLAQALSGSRSKNLGLDHAVFGNVKQVQLSSYLQHSLHSASAPTPSLSSAPSISASPSPSIFDSTPIYAGPPSLPPLPFFSRPSGPSPHPSPSIYQHGPSPFPAPGCSRGPSSTGCHETISPEGSPFSSAPGHFSPHSPKYSPAHGKYTSPCPSEQRKVPAPFRHSAMSPRNHPRSRKVYKHAPSGYLAPSPSGYKDYPSPEVSLPPALSISSVSGRSEDSACMFILLMVMGTLLLMNSTWL